MSRAAWMAAVAVLAAALASCRMPDEAAYYERDEGSIGVEGGGSGGSGSGGSPAVETVFFEPQPDDGSGRKGYTFRTNDPAYIVPGGRTVMKITGSSYVNSASMTVSKKSGSATAGYGMVFFYNKNGGKEYMMTVMINTRRQYKIDKVADGQIIPISGGWVTAQGLKGGFGVQNTIGVSHSSDGKFHVKFNGVEETTFTDPAAPIIPKGTTGCIVAISDSEGFPQKFVEVSFTE